MPILWGISSVADRPLRMRDVVGSIPTSSNVFVFLFPKSIF